MMGREIESEKEKIYMNIIDSNFINLHEQTSE